MAKVQIAYGAVPSSGLTDWTEVFVEHREEWDGDWERVDYLEPLWASESASPRLPQASFRYRYGGEQKREDATSFEPESPLDLSGHYVRIRAVPQDSQSEQPEPKTIWIGMVVSEAFDIYGTDGDPTGDQGVRAVGLEFLLDRTTIGTAWAANDAGDEEIEIGWAPTFNERYRRGEYELGNQGSALGAGSGVFGGEDPWTFKDIASYVLNRWSPPDFDFKLSGPYETLHQFVDVVPHEGLTPRQILDHVISAQRGYGWCVRFDDESGNVRVHVFTLTGKTITFGDKSLPANRERASMAFDDARDISAAIVSVDEVVRVDEVLIQGARVRSCFTLSHVDGSMDRRWPQALQDSYVRLSVDDDPTGERADHVRAHDVFWRVFQVFGPPDGWNWKVNGEGEGTDAVVPYVDDEGKQSDRDENGEKREGAHFRQGKAFLQELPFTRQASQDSDEPEYMPPFAVVKIPKDSGSSEDFYAYMEKVGAGNSDHEPGYVRMVDRELSVHIDTRDNHALALNHWSSTEGDPGPTAHQPTMDWQELLITVNLETDERLKVRVKITELDDDQEPQRRLVVNVPDAHFWWVVKNTVTGLLRGEVQRHGGSSAERDDSERLRAIAAWCKGWYSEPRARVSLELQKIFHGLRVGTYVENASSSWHSKRVGTVVTERVWQFGDGPNGRQTTRVRTDYEEPAAALMG